MYPIRYFLNHGHQDSNRFHIRQYKEYISEHRQVRDALKDNKKIKASKKLKELHDLRKKADYDLFNPLTNNDLDKAMKNMNDIINELEFQKGE